MPAHRLEKCASDGVRNLCEATARFARSQSAPDPDVPGYVLAGCKEKAANLATLPKLNYFGLGLPLVLGALGVPLWPCPVEGADRVVAAPEL
jgi:hypothetical protein